MLHDNVPLTRVIKWLWIQLINCINLNLNTHILCCNFWSGGDPEPDPDSDVCPSSSVSFSSSVSSVFIWSLLPLRSNKHDHHQMLRKKMYCTLTLQTRKKNQYFMTKQMTGWVGGRGGDKAVKISLLPVPLHPKLLTISLVL